MYYILIVFTNICTNPELLPEIAHDDILEIIINLYNKDNMMKGYASTIISTFCRIMITRSIILENKLIFKFVTDIYTSNPLNKKKLLFSILTILNYSQDFHQ